MTAAEALSRVRGMAPALGWPVSDDVAVWPLAGGISNDIFAVRIGSRTVVIKAALAQLRVAADWRSEITRIHREVACQRWLAGVLEPGEVPAVLWEDLTEHWFVMEYVPDTALNWKSALLAGELLPDAARRAGDLLGRVHRAGADQAGLRTQFGDKQVFWQLRVDPYLNEVARVQPELEPWLRPWVERLMEASETIVHGDFSPKNLLVDDEPLILLDHEVAHYGDSRFDLGFLFCHLTLKAGHLPAHAEQLWAQLPAGWAAYAQRYDRWREADWLPLLGAMLLARVDGKSPAEYLTDGERERVRPLGEALLRGEVTELVGVRRFWEQAAG